MGSQTPETKTETSKKKESWYRAEAEPLTAQKRIEDLTEHRAVADAISDVRWLNSHLEDLKDTDKAFLTDKLVALKNQMDNKAGAFSTEEHVSHGPEKGFGDSDYAAIKELEAALAAPEKLAEAA